MSTKPPILRFGAFELDRVNRELRRGGVPVELGSRYFDALVLLVERQGELVTKDEFMSGVWRGIPVTDEALTQCIRTLRRALDDSATSPRFIHTVPKHGYRFSADAPKRSESAVQLSISRIAAACTLSGSAAGIVAGLFYGIVAGTGGGGHVLILAAMVGAFGLLAGAGLGIGIAASTALRRQTDYWALAGAALGGLGVGALGNLLGREGVGLLSGIAIGEVTGPFEGLILGSATGIVATTVSAGFSRRPTAAIVLLAGTSAGLLIDLAGGTLLAGSLWTVQKGLPGAQLAVERVGTLIGQPEFTVIAQSISTIAEAVLFVAAMAGGLLALREEGAPRY